MNQKHLTKSNINNKTKTSKQLRTKESMLNLTKNICKKFIADITSNSEKLYFHPKIKKRKGKKFYFFHLYHHCNTGPES